MKRPLLLPAVLFIGGILLGRWLQPSLIPLFAGALSCALAAMLWPFARPWLLSTLLILAGATDISWQTRVVSPHDLRLLCGQELRMASVQGTLHASPTARIFERRGHEFWHSSVTLDVERVKFSDDWQEAAGKIIAFTPGTLASNIFQGQRVEVVGVIGPPAGPRAEGLFDGKSFYAEQNIFYQLTTQSAGDWTVSPINALSTPPLADRFSSWARGILSLGLGPEDTPTQLTWTLALDWKAPLTEPIEEPFLRAGTFHIFAVDGLRIGLLAAIGTGLLRALRTPRVACGLIVIPLLWLYADLTGWPASAIRAAVMMSIVLIAWAVRRPADLLNSLLAAALLILLWQPTQLFQPGFQLSFLVVGCVALILPPIRARLQGWIFRADPFLPTALKPHWPPFLRSVVTFIIDTAAMALAAWLGSIPLAATYFHLFNPISIPANFVVVPITALSLMSASASLAVGGWFPALAVIFNHATWFFIDCVLRFSQWAGHLPGSALYVAAPSLLFYLIYYPLLFATLTGWIFRFKYKWATMAAWSALTIIWSVQHVQSNRAAHLHVLPLDGGAACFAEHFDQRDILFDCGNFGPAENITKPFLAAHGVNRLDAFALTVGHVQDTGGAPVIATNFSVQEVLLNPSRDRSPVYRKIIDSIKLVCPWRDATNGEEIDGWTVFHVPPAPKSTAADDNATVFYRSFDGARILLLSSLGRNGQDALRAAYPGWRADIVVAGLPAADEPLSPPLLEQLQPKLIIITDSALPARRRASAKLRARLGESKARVIYCRDAGALKLNFEHGAWEVKNSGDSTSPFP